MSKSLRCLRVSVAALVLLVACTGCLTADLWGWNSKRGSVGDFGRRAGPVGQILGTPFTLVADASFGLLLLWLLSEDDDDDEWPSYGRTSGRRRDQRKPRKLHCAK